MSVLVAALARTKNFATSGTKSESKSSKSDKSSKCQSSKDVPAAAAASEPEPSDATATVIAEEEKDSYPEELTYPTELVRSFSKHSVCDSEDDESESAHAGEEYLGPNLGPIVPLKEQLERDKEDESLRRWKEQLLGQVRLDTDAVEPEVKFLSLGMTSPGRPDVTIPLPIEKNSKGVTFTLKEGALYRLKFTFEVHNNIVSGLKYVHTVWKGALQVDHTKIMLGTFSPQVEPYTHAMEEETTPSGALARGAYTAKTKFVDDDEKCYLEIDYTFEIRKDWTHHQRKWSLGAF